MTNVLDTSVDHVVPAGEYVWLTVGKYSVRISAGTENQCKIDVYELGKEDQGTVGPTIEWGG